MTIKVPSAFYTYIEDPAERMISTFIQQFVMLMLPSLVVVGHTIAPLQVWATAADSAGFAAVMALLTTLVGLVVPSFRNKTLTVLGDAVWRLGATFLQSVIGTMAASKFTPSLVHAPWLGAVGVAIPVTAAAALKIIASLNLPWTHLGSLAPFVPDKTQDLAMVHEPGHLAPRPAAPDLRQD